MQIDRVGRYQIKTLLGQGGMGQVYQAHDPDLKRDVAIKLIALPVTVSGDSRRRFQQEVQAAAQLNHPHIITIFDVELKSEPAYVVMELLKGGTLKDRLQAQHLAWPEALRLLQPLGQALAHAHQKGIIHRDVKPVNVMFTEGKAGTLKLVDFGLARWQEGSGLSMSGEVMGTPAYMAPEQANGEPLDGRVDIYAFGVILFEAIAGYNPQDRGSIGSTLAAICSFEPIDLTALNDKAPPQLVKIIRKALAKDREERYNSIEALLDDLAAWSGNSNALESFGELLNHYIRRLGVSDAEVARALGVRRQTIFRWREGLTARPRQRDDVLLLAQKLRLTTEEQDRLLLAAGFAPTTLEIVQYEAVPEIPTSSPSTAELQTRPEMQVGISSAAASSLEALPPNTGETLKPIAGGWLRRPRLAAGLLALVVVALAGLWWGGWLRPPVPSTPPLVSSTTYGIEPAQSAETLILVTEFVNHTGGQAGYNVADRLKEGLEQEQEAAGLENTRIEIWPEEINLHKNAIQAGQSVSATVTIYGEYDTGRVVVHFAPAEERKLQIEVSDQRELSAVINNLSAQVRPLALLILGQIYLNQDKAEAARQVLEQARQRLQNQSEVNNQTWGTLYFYLGLAYAKSQPPQLSQAIEAYSQALKARPQLISARQNRSVAYGDRRRKGDLELALADADELVRVAPDWPAAHNNRATILIALGGTDNLTQAEAELNKTLELDPNLVSALINRAIVRFQQGQPVENWHADLDTALALEPERSAAWNMLCWGYAVENQPEQALPNCDKAIELDPRPVYRDSRGLAYALQGEFEKAGTDFQAYITWLEAQPGEGWQATLVKRQAWVKVLEAGENPFTPEVLRELRGD